MFSVRAATSVIPLVLVLGCGADASQADLSAEPSQSTETVASEGLAVDEGEGTGFLTVADLPGSGIEDSFNAAPDVTPAELVVQSSGCIELVIAGTAFVPLWPDGTSVRQDSQDLSTYEVVLGTGATLTGRAGEQPTRITVSAVLGSRTAEPEPGGKVDSLRSFCSPSAPFVVVADVNTTETNGATS